MDARQRSRLIAASFATQAVAIGFTLGSLAVFMAPIESELGASRTQLSLMVSIWNVAMGLASPVAGRMLDRGSPRALMLAGAAISGASLLLASIATQFWQVLALWGIGTSIGTTLLGPLASSTLIARRIPEQAGRALGLANMGSPAGPVVAAPLAGFLVASFGWRPAFATFGLATLAIGGAAVALGIERAARSAGDGGAPPDAASERGPEPAADGGASFFGARAFWGLVVAVAIVVSVGIALSIHWVGVASERGMSLAAATALISINAAAAIAGNAGFGWLSDRVAPHRLFAGAIALQAIAFGALFATARVDVVVAAAALFGLTGGATMPLYAALITRHFGAASFGRVMGAGGLVGLPFTFLAPTLAGAAYDTTGSYALALASGALLLALATVLIGFVVGAKRAPSIA